MELVGLSVKVRVNEPWEMSADVLSGEVVKQISYKEILVKLNVPIKGEKITSDLLRLKTRYVGDDFRPLENYETITVGGTLVDIATDEYEYLIIGSVSLI